MVYTAFTIVDEPDAPFLTDEGWQIDGLPLAPSRKVPDCITAITNTPSLCLSESRRFHVDFEYAWVGNHRSWGEHSHYYLKGDALLLEVYLNGQWYTIPSTMSSQTTSTSLMGEMEFILPEEYAQTFPTGIRIMDGLDTTHDWYPAATADQRFAVSATIVVRGQTVSAADYLRSLGWEILPDELHRVQTHYFPDTTETALAAVTREQIYSVTLEDIATFYGCEARDVGATFIGAVHG